MPKFEYIASDSEGREKSGVVDAVNKVAALAKLKKMGLGASSIAEATGKTAKRAGASGPAKGGGLQMQIQIPMPAFLRPRVKRKQLMVFTRQLATLIDAGVPLLRALNILEAQEKNPTLKRMIGEMGENVEGGGTFADALGQHPKVFDKLFINMVKAGEIGGVLEITLNRLAEFSEKAEQTRTKVTGAMIYPLVVLVMALGIVTFMMVFIIPKFSEIFEDLMEGQELPVVTQFVVSTSDILTQRFHIVIGSIVLVVVLIRLFGKTKFGRYALDLFKLRVPVFGNLVSKVGISRFSRTLGTLMTSGVQILQALNIVRDTAGNEVIARAVQSVHDSVKEGETVADPLQVSGVFPTIVVSMITVGEETGRLPEMLTKIADTYDTEVDAAVEGLTSIIEPVLIVSLAVVVGVIVVAMFMPLISIMSNLR
ncbi:type II secretion system F family protein [Verrucomicrobiota bacterium]